MQHNNDKNEIEQIPNIDHQDGINDDKVRDLEPTQIQSLDRLSVWQAAKVYRRVGLFCFLAAFSASLDGYQGHFNGSIVSNKGFIQQFAPPGTKILNAKWVSAWGGTASAAQFASQISIAFASDKLGRRNSLWITWILLTASIFAESFVTTNGGWLGAKILSGAGVGAMQGTLPLYINELAPTQIRGLFTEAYTFWYVTGQLMSSVALQQLNQRHPYDFRLAIYTQWAMIGGLAIVYALIPESPWWLVGQGKDQRARKTLLRLKGAGTLLRKSKLTQVEERVLQLSDQVQTLETQMRELQYRLANAPGGLNEDHLRASHAADLESRSADRPGHELVMDTGPDSGPATGSSTYPPFSSQDPTFDQHSFAPQPWSAANRASSSFDLHLANPQPHLQTNRRSGADTPDDLGAVTPLGKIVEQAEATRHAVTTALLDLERQQNGPSKRQRIQLDEDSGVGYGRQTVLAHSGAAQSLSPEVCEGVFDFFYLHCHPCLPILRPETDTASSLRGRSPFLFHTIMYIGAMLRDQHTGVDELYLEMRTRAYSFAKESLIGTSSLLPPIEEVQAMVLLAAWGDSSWRSSGHALRLAIESGLHRSLASLDQSKTGSEGSDSAAVAGSRVWLAICKAEFEAAFNHGRPVLVGDDPSTMLGRRLLKHPLSTVADTRLVAAVELLQGRARRHLALVPVEYNDVTELAAEVVSDGQVVERWSQEWFSYYDFIGVREGDYFRDLIISSKCHATLTSQCRLLRETKASSAHDALSSARKVAVQSAARAASTLLRLTVGTTGYARFFPTSNRYTHAGMMVAVRLLICLMGISPSAVDRYEVAGDIDKFIDLLRRISEHASADRLLKVVGRARRSGVLPSPTNASTGIDQSIGGTSIAGNSNDNGGLDWLNELLLQDSPNDPTLLQGANDLQWLLEPDLLADVAQWSSKLP